MADKRITVRYTGADPIEVLPWGDDHPHRTLVEPGGTFTTTAAHAEGLLANKDAWQKTKTIADEKEAD